MSVTRAEPPAPNPLPVLIDDLASEDFRTRELASKKLEAVGEPALEPLRKAARIHADPEATRRALELVERIARRVDSEKTIAPSLVELDFKEKPLGDAIAAIEAQTEYRITLTDITVRQKVVTIKTEGKVAFWTAVDQICEAAGLELAIPPASASSESKPSPYQQDPFQNQFRGSRGPTAPPPIPVVTSSITLRYQNGDRRAACVHGGVRVTTAAVPESVYTNYPAGMIPVVIEATPEPKLKWERVVSISVSKATDASGGQDLIALSSVSSYSDLVYRMPASMLFPPRGFAPFPQQTPEVAQGVSFHPQPTQGLARLKSAKDQTKRLAELHGIVRGTIRTAPEELAAVTKLDTDGKPAPARGPNGVTLTVTGVAVNKVVNGTPLYEIDVTVCYNSLDVRLSDADRASSQQVIVVQNGVRRVRRQMYYDDFAPAAQLGGLSVSDSEGRAFLLTTPSYYRQFDADGRTIDSLKLITAVPENKIGKPATVTFTATRAKSVEVPFTLTGIPVGVGLGTTEAPPPAP